MEKKQIFLPLVFLGLIRPPLLVKESALDYMVKDIEYQRLSVCKGPLKKRRTNVYKKSNVATRQSIYKYLQRLHLYR